jgi:hypothetical protein
MHIGDWSESGSVKSFGGGNKSQTPSPTTSDGSAGDNTALPGSPTAWGVPFVHTTLLLKQVPVV